VRLWRRTRWKVQMENIYWREGDNIFTCVSKLCGVGKTRVNKDYLVNCKHVRELSLNACVERSLFDEAFCFCFLGLGN
jgi:hypothetical protein